MLGAISKGLPPWLPVGAQPRLEDSLVHRLISYPNAQRASITELCLCTIGHWNGPLQIRSDIIEALGFDHVTTIIAGGNSFSCLPPQITAMARATHLFVNDCRELQTLEGIQNMEGLRELEAEGCKLTHWPELPPHVEKVSLIGNRIPTMGAWPPSLTELTLPRGTVVSKQFLKEFQGRCTVESRMARTFLAIKYTRRGL